MTVPLTLTEEGSLYAQIGPAALAKLVRRFYALVAQHPALAPIFPADLTLTAEKQLAFLTGFFGGPPLYHQQFGHPRLRARHLPFAITPQRAQAWLACMHAALHDTPEIPAAQAQQMYAALARVAVHMVNTAPPAEAEGESSHGQLFTND